mmetsp:Transcript_20255/g.29929  ORF Transcript_20255/g.29929 Transcript_20255/m.29929 type:complete len:159 (-) Transcript_20255:171-647(-)
MTGETIPSHPSVPQSEDRSKNIGFSNQIEVFNPVTNAVEIKEFCRSHQDDAAKENHRSDSIATEQTIISLSDGHVDIDHLNCSPSKKEEIQDDITRSNESSSLRKGKVKFADEVGSKLEVSTYAEDLYFSPSNPNYSEMMMMCDFNKHHTHSSCCIIS